MKANKTLVYYQAGKNYTRVEDCGDILVVSWRNNSQIKIVIDLTQPATVVLNKLHEFFGAKPKNGSRPYPQQQQMWGQYGTRQQQPQ
jgi:hypothetical protein